MAGKARYYLRRHALRTAAVLATACLLIDGLKAAAAAAARKGAAAAASAGLLAPLAPLAAAAAADAAAAAAGDVAEGEQGKAEVEKKKEKEGAETATKTTAGEEPATRRERRRGKARHLLRLAASGAVALARKAVEAALPTPLLAAWLVAELML